MKIPINLASQPFRRDRAMIVASAAVGLLLVVTLGMQIALIAQDRAQMADVRRDIVRLNREIKQKTAEDTRYASVLNRPENREALETTVFLNSLLYRKGISWTRIFNDLEKTLPHNVKIVQIQPSVNAANKVQLVMTVASESIDAQIALLKALENSPLFGEVMEPQRIHPSQADPLYRFRVTVNYGQKL
jgi:Tfp pilus assembly protein PilN